MKGDQKKEDKEVLKRRRILEEPFKKVALEFLVTLVVVVVLLYLGLLMVSRTAGFRSLISERLSEEVGCEFEVGKSRLDLKLNLHASEIKSEGEPRDVGRVNIDSLSAYWNLSGLLSADEPVFHKITVDGVSVLAIHTGKEKGWQPPVFGFLGSIEGFGSERPPVRDGGATASRGTDSPESSAGEQVPAQPSAAAEQLAATAAKPDTLRSVVEVSNSHLNIIGPGAQRLANFGNLQFSYVPSYNEGLEVQLYELRGDYVLQNTRIPRQKIEVEVLHTGDQMVVRKLRAGAQMLMRLSRAFSGKAEVREESMAVLPPPPVPRPPEPEMVIVADPLRPSSLQPPAAPGLEPPLAPAQKPEPKPEPATKVAEGTRGPELPPIHIPAVKSALQIKSPAVEKPAAPARKEQQPAPVPLVLRDLPGPLPSSRPETPPLVGDSPEKVPGTVAADPVAVPPATSDPAPAVIEVKPVPAPALPPVRNAAQRETKPPVQSPPAVKTPRIISETVIENTPVPPREPGEPAEPNPVKPDESVVSEIERVLQDALDVRLQAQRQREAALKKFSDITNDFIAISNEIEQAIGSEAPLEPPSDGR